MEVTLKLALQESTIKKKLEKNWTQFSSDLRYFNVTNKQISIWFLFSEDYIQKQLGLCFN